MNLSQKVGHLDLFSGAGGFSQALRYLNESFGTVFRTVAALDINPVALESHALNFPEAEHVCEDVRKVDYRRWRGKVKIITAGSPCNDFSIVGDKKGLAGEYGNLMFEPIRAMRETGASLLVFENVPGILNAPPDGVPPMSLLIRYLQSQGFDCMWHTFDFQYLQVPQSRRRVLLVAWPENEWNVWRDIQTVPEETTELTCDVAYSWPISEHDSEHDTSRPLSEDSRKILPYIPPGGNRFSPEVEVHFPTDHYVTKLSNVYRRNARWRSSYTLLSSAAGAKVHPDEDRFSSPRELGLIASFPSDYLWAGTYTKKCAQIGMAVPPIGIANILAHVLNLSTETTPIKYLDVI